MREKRKGENRGEEKRRKKGEEKGNFPTFRRSKLDGRRVKVDPRNESYAWEPKSWSFVKLHDVENFPTDSCHSRVIRNQQYLYPKFPPIAVVKLLQYSGSRVEHRDEFSSYK